jgi:hypothetical protein
VGKPNGAVSTRMPAQSFPPDQIACQKRVCCYSEHECSAVRTKKAIFSCCRHTPCGRVTVASFHATFHCRNKNFHLLKGVLLFDNSPAGIEVCRHDYGSTDEEPSSPIHAWQVASFTASSPPGLINSSTRPLILSCPCKPRA